MVITGAAGFIGSHLSETLLDRGYSVVGIDNLLTGDLANIAHLANRDFLFIKHDVTNYINVDGPVDFVLHWASPASPIDYLELPIQTLKVGALGTHKALGLAKAKGARFVIASTSEVYGDPLEHPQTETYWGNVNPVGPRGVYDEAKRFAEAMTVAYHRYHGVDAKIVRIFNTYGPRMRLKDGRAVPELHQRRPCATKTSRSSATARQTRSFCYVSDLVDGIIRLMLSDVNDPVNIGNPHELTHRRDRPDDRPHGRRVQPDRLTCRCRPTTRRSASPTSRGRARCSAGNPRFPWKRGSRRRSPTSRRRWRFVDDAAGVQHVVEP